MKKPYPKPRLTVIVPIVLVTKYLKETLESVRKQSMKDVTILCVDATSDPKTKKFLRSYTKRYKQVKNISLSESATPQYAVTVGFMKATTRYVAWVLPGNVLLKKRLELQYRHMEEHWNTIAVGCHVQHFKRGVPKTVYPSTNAEIKSSIFVTLPMDTETLMINKRKLPPSFRLFMRNKAHIEDFDLLYRLLQYGKFTNLTLPLLKRRNDFSQMSLDTTSMWGLRLAAVTKYGYIPDVGAIGKKVATQVSHLFKSKRRHFAKKYLRIAISNS